MDREDIWRMAKQAGGREARNPELYDCFIMSLDDLERLYHHAAAAERDKYEAKFKQLEAIMQEREQQPNKPCCLAEREACAKVAETYEAASSMKDAPHIALIFKACAAAIRARSNP